MDLFSKEFLDVKEYKVEFRACPISRDKYNIQYRIVTSNLGWFARNICGNAWKEVPEYDLSKHKWSHAVWTPEKPYSLNDMISCYVEQFKTTGDIERYIQEMNNIDYDWISNHPAILK